MDYIPKPGADELVSIFCSALPVGKQFSLTKIQFAANVRLEASVSIQKEECLEERD